MENKKTTQNHNTVKQAQDSQTKATVKSACAKKEKLNAKPGQATPAKVEKKIINLQK